MKLARPLVWTLVGLAVAVVVVVFVAMRCAGSDGAREQIERRLSEAVARPVTIGALEVSNAATHAELRDVVIAPPPALAEHGDFVRIGSLQFDVGTDQLRRGEVTGTVVGRDVELTLVREGGVTSVQGLGRRDRPSGSDLSVDLAFELVDARVTLLDVDRGETITLRQVGVRGVLSDDGTDRDAGLQVTIAEVEVAGVTIRDVLLSGSAHEGAFAVHRLHARIGEGEVEGRGRFDPGAGEAGAAWGVAVDARNIALDGPVAEIVARLYPAVGGSPGDVGGTIGGNISLAGEGLTRARAQPSLRGQGELVLADLAFAPTSLAASLFRLAGARHDDVQLAEATVTFRIEDGWVHLDEVTSSEASLDLRLRGKVSLTGALDLTADLMPLVQAFGGGIYEQAARHTTRIPVRVTGTVRQPELAAPPAEEVAKGVLGGLLRRALTEPPAE